MPGRAAEALVRRGDDDVELPGGGLQRHAAQGGDAVRQREHPAGPGGRADAGQVVDGPARGLAVDRGEQPGLRVLVEVGRPPRRGRRRAPRHGQVADIGPEFPQPAAHRPAVRAGDQVQGAGFARAVPGRGRRLPARAQPRRPSGGSRPGCASARRPSSRRWRKSSRKAGSPNRVAPGGSARPGSALTSRPGRPGRVKSGAAVGSHGGRRRAGVRSWRARCPAGPGAVNPRRQGPAPAEAAPGPTGRAGAWLTGRGTARLPRTWRSPARIRRAGRGRRAAGRRAGSAAAMAMAWRTAAAIRFPESRLCQAGATW